MIIQPQTSYLPQLDGRNFKRKWKTAKLKTKRYTKAKMRKARTKANVIIRRQYFVTDAQADARLAITRNEDIFINTVIMAVLLGYSFSVSAVDLLILFFQTAYDIAGISGINLLLLSVLVVGVLGVLATWLIAFAFNLMSLAVLEGANGKIKRSTRRTYRKSLHYASRTANVWFILLAIISVPLLFIAIPTYLYTVMTDMTQKEMIALIPKCAGLAGIWIIAALTHVGLAPYVALFNPKLSYKDAYRRSYELVKRRGRLFLAACYLIFAGGVVAIYQVAALVQHVLGVAQIALFTTGVTLLLVHLNAVLVAFYRKRTLARKY
jgi:hypothetical protein